MATQLSVERREKRPRSILTQLRHNGRIPAVVYGNNSENELVHLEGSDVIRLLQQEGLSSVIQLKYTDGKTRQVMIRELQQDRIKDKILHIDFKVVKMNEPVDVEVAVYLEGEASGVKEGGVLQQQLRTVHIRTLPGLIPDHLSIDISALSIGDAIYVKDLKLPEKAELLSELEEMVASVLPPQVEKDANEEAEETAQAEAETADDEAEEKEA
ncbi:50S ribosomal protein L25/general stress protein Ctc [Desmospora activa]|uniref:Large ribosomal subunit protein bL25 n=1 Tax=Desmospora activa DSM 45169 TaxID=1121389 RepID=A0A2T4Z256_9BACL|nr:50S ribosomal protein L25/general stress protein Ctc [Desmospora activa]PTM54821.1 large subunit ribosomal protein L25 [Desmospora activa DSM 45169]